MLVCGSWTEEDFVSLADCPDRHRGQFQDLFLVFVFNLSLLSFVEPKAAYWRAHIPPKGTFVPGSGLAEMFPIPRWTGGPCLLVLTQAKQKRTACGAINDAIIGRHKKEP